MCETWLQSQKLSDARLFFSDPWHRALAAHCAAVEVVYSGHSSASALEFFRGNSSTCASLRSRSSLTSQSNSSSSSRASRTRGHAASKSSRCISRSRACLVRWGHTRPTATKVNRRTLPFKSQSFGNKALHSRKWRACRTSLTPQRGAHNTDRSHRCRSRQRCRSRRSRRHSHSPV